MGVGFSLWKTTPARPVPQVSPDTVLRLLLRDSHEGHRELRSYSLEELKELMNKLMLMSGKKDHNSAGVEEFSEVGPGSSVGGGGLSAEYPQDSWKGLGLITRNCSARKCEGLQGT